MAKNALEIAVDAEEAAEELVTALAKEGADEATLKVLKQAASVYRQVVKGLGPGPEDGAAEPDAVAQEAEDEVNDREAEAAAATSQTPAGPRNISEATDQMIAERKA